MAGSAALIVLLGALCHHRLPVLGLAVLGLASVLAVPLLLGAVAPAAAVEPIALTVLAAFAGMAGAALAGDERLARAVARSCAWAGAAVAFHGVVQRLWGLERLARAVSGDPTLPDRAAVLLKLESARAFAGFSTPAALGGFLALTLPVTIALARQARGRNRGVWIVLAGLQVAGFVATASATAALALLVATAIATLLWSRRRRAMIVAVAVLFVVLAGVVAQRGVLRTPADPSGPLRQRAGNFGAALEMASDHPWSGVGPGGFSESYLMYRRPGGNEVRHAHSLPLELAAELGWPAAVLLSLTFFAIFVGPLWRSRGGSGDPWRRAVSVGLAAFAVQNLADFTFYMPSILWTASLLRGLIGRPLHVAEEPVWSRASASAGFALLVGAAIVASLSGVSRDARFAARQAAHAGEQERVMELAERATRWAPWDIDAALALARATAGPDSMAKLPAARWELALERAELAVRLSPRRAAARELRATARLALGDLPGAWADLDQAVRLDPGQPRYAPLRDAVRERLE